MPPEDRTYEGPFPPQGDVGAWMREIIVASIVFVLVLLFIGAWLISGLDWYRAFLDAIYRVWDRIRAMVKVLLILGSIGLVGFIVTIWRRFNALKNALPRMTLGGKKVGVAPMKPERAKKEIGNEWQEIQNLMGSGSASDWNMAVLRADTLLDDVLQYLDYEGTTVAERLAKVDPFAVPSLDRLFSAHRLRNAIAHDPSAPHTRETLAYALRVYEMAFKEMGVMEERTSHSVLS